MGYIRSTPRAGGVIMYEKHPPREISPNVREVEVGQHVASTDYDRYRSLQNAVKIEPQGAERRVALAGLLRS